MLRSRTIFRILLAFAMHSAAIAGCFCAVAQAGCGDYLHTKMGPPQALHGNLHTVRHRQLDTPVAVNHSRLNLLHSQHPINTELSYTAPGPAKPQPCTGWHCQQQKTPWLPLPKPATQLSRTADAVLTSGLHCPANARMTCPLWIQQPLPVPSAPGRPIDYPPELSTQLG